jgi:predicted nucleic acid-binding protein
VDASVVAKWILPIEVNLENALKLKRDHNSGEVELFAPSFLTFEVTNALWKAVTLKRTTQEDAQQTLKTLNNTEIRLYELDWNAASEVLDVACALNMAIYDAAYLLISEKTKAPLITSDTQLYEKAKKHFKVIHLKDYL